MLHVKLIRKVVVGRANTARDRIIESKPGLYRRFLCRSGMAAIRLKCFECIGGSSWLEVKKCCIASCFLHPFRFGKKPKGEYS